MFVVEHDHLPAHVETAVGTERDQPAADGDDALQIELVGLVAALLVELATLRGRVRKRDRLREAGVRIDEPDEARVVGDNG